MMRYFILETGGALDYFGEADPRALRVCPGCDVVSTPLLTNLKVGFNQRPTPDALTVAWGPAWVVSEALRQVIDSTASESDVNYLSVHDREGMQVPFWQVFVQHRLRTGRGSLFDAVPCDLCAGQARLELDPLFLAKPANGGPAIATLEESERVCLVREDLADAIRAAGLDVQLKPAFFDGEIPTHPGNTFPDQNQDWSDL